MNEFLSNPDNVPFVTVLTFVAGSALAVYVGWLYDQKKKNHDK